MLLVITLEALADPWWLPLTKPEFTIEDVRRHREDYVLRCHDDLTEIRPDRRTGRRRFNLTRSHCRWMLLDPDPERW